MNKTITAYFLRQIYFEILPSIFTFSTKIEGFLSKCLSFDRGGESYDRLIFNVFGTPDFSGRFSVL